MLVDVSSRRTQPAYCYQHRPYRRRLIGFIGHKMDAVKISERIELNDSIYLQTHAHEIVRNSSHDILSFHWIRQFKEQTNIRRL